jgi:hypothetical protein
MARAVCSSTPLSGAADPHSYKPQRQTEKGQSTTQKVNPCKWTSPMGTSEKISDLAMGRRPIAISEESALVPIEETRLYFSSKFVFVHAHIYGSLLECF